MRAVATGPFILGKPVPILVEATNQGDQTVCFDAQEIGHDPFEIRKADGTKVRYVDPTAGGVGTFQHIVALEPGRTRDLVTVDLAEKYAIFEPGEYIFRFTGCGKWDMGPDTRPNDAPPGSLVVGVPESPPLRFQIGEGTLGLRDRLIRQLLPILPEGWILHEGSRFKGGDRSRDVHLVFHQWTVRGSSLHAAFSIYCVLTPGMDIKDTRRLGKSAWGEVWIGALSLQGKSNRKASDDAIETQLRDKFIPGMEQQLVKVLDLR